ncbi:MAG: Ig-like domain-containing protein [Treponema sp.]|nr:Ig-like domain-containing protein [Treponema sp.]MCL2252277.1 Ig-like domain-containing protein [Treponema sp.]
MKTIKLLVVFSAIAVLLSSCELLVALGSQVDLDGPNVEFVSPTSRKAVTQIFDIEGTVSDNYNEIGELLIKAETNNEPFQKQWRYIGGSWEVSEDFGINWSAYSEGNWIYNSNEAKYEWKIEIDMAINGQDTADGEYVFILQAWDINRNSDENSFRTRVFLIDRTPPKVSVSSPNLYSRYSYTLVTDTFANDELEMLHNILDTDETISFDPSYIGRFISNDFLMQWQLEDNMDIWSIDLILCKIDAEVDEDTDTPIQQNDIIYRYHKNTDPVPSIIEPGKIQPVNGQVMVPGLNKASGSYADGGELINPISEKTTIKVVAVCYDIAGIRNQEKVVGYFIYWPRADLPWITFTDEMEDMNLVSDYYNKPVSTIVDKVFMIYPSKSVKATAFQAHAVKKIEYSLFKIKENGLNLGDGNNPADLEELDPAYMNQVIENPPQGAGEIRSNIFSWEAVPPPRSGYYLIKVTAYGEQESQISKEYHSLFRVQDITFPNFPTPPTPIASRPLFEAIGKNGAAANTIRISGEVSDATAIRDLTMVWINPESRNYAAMSQLSYFQDPYYDGWSQAKTLNPGQTGVEMASFSVNPEYPYDADNPNRLWRFSIDPNPQLNHATNRMVYKYSIDVNLSNHLNIGIGPTQQPLSSQVFLLRAENPDGKCTVITYAPKGDASAPVINITNVVITQPVSVTTCIPNQYTLIPKFSNGDKIEINGTWREDSAEFLPIGTYFTPTFEVTLNGNKLTNVTINQNSGTSIDGTWKADLTLASSAAADALRDTLVVTVSAKDIGGNPAPDTQAAWLIESDTLKLLRISSENADQTYSNGDIYIFLEFNKPVRLAENAASAPVLTLNAGTGTTAVYQANASLSTRQVFRYQVSPGNNTPNNSFLTVSGLQNPGDWAAANYPFQWYRMNGDVREEIRITNVASHNGGKPGANSFYARNLPVTTNIADADYQYTLIAGKNIKIDTAAPVLQSITTNMAEKSYSTDSEVTISLNFDSPVIYAGTPSLMLAITNGATITKNTNSVSATGNTITFGYRVAAGDTTNGNPIVVNNFSGTITDLAGNALASNAITAMTQTNRTLANRFIDAIQPGVPRVRILSANNINSVVLNYVTNAQNNGDSNAANRTLSNLFSERLWLAIEGNTTTPPGQHKLDVLEYSINNGQSWVKAGNITNTPVELTQIGQYNVIARQYDRAGNVSANSNAVSFTWDPGEIITGINSSNPNGTYTNAAGRNTLDITVSFRNEFFIAPGATLTLNVQRDGTNLSLSPATAPSAKVKELTFRYTIQDGDAVPNGANLDVISINNLVLWDGTAVGNGVRLNDTSTPATTINHLTASQHLTGNKQFKIETGTLSFESIEFITDNSAGSGYDNESNSNFHGIRTDDGSYWTTLVLHFNHNISKGDGMITITQNAANYRLPTVLTETQYNRFRSIAGFDTYYQKGTNGYINGIGSDTSTKYVMRYEYNPDSAVTAAWFDPAALDTTQTLGPDKDTLIPSTFHTAFRTAESIQVSVNAQAVTIDGRTLKIRLMGSNAPQVPGASYTVKYPAGLVQDALDNSSLAEEHTNVHLRGAAKPFVRIRKMQDTIAVTTVNGGAGNGNAPRLVATQPMYAYVRMDSRTPGAVIRYGTDTKVTNVNVNTSANNSNNWSTGGTPNDAPDAANDPGIPAPTVPAGITAGTAYPADAGNDRHQIRIGNADYQGYQWRIIARAFVTGSNAASSSGSDEMAYRTVLTYQLRNAGNEISATSGGGTNLEAGDQVWIRGGDAIGASNIPGFPLTWDDNWNNLSGRRAGIRLMSKTNTTSSLNNSVWQWVTWEINTIAYVDFIKGRDLTETVSGFTYNASSADVAWQYGPKRYAYQRAGWTSFKDRYPIYPGKHRICDAGYDHANKGDINFSGTFTARPASTETNNPPTFPGVNSR